MKHFFTTLLLFIASVLGRASTYYVSSTGNDDNNGRTIGNAWKTISKVNKFSFQPGDVVLFQAGATFAGTIDKPYGAGGTNGNPIIFNSYGGGKATISSGTGEGIYIGSDGNVTIKNLVIKGAGYMATSMWKNGINFYMEEGDASDMKNITIDNVDVSGYGGNGILISTGSSEFGYSKVRVTNSLVHDNGMGGIQLMGSWDDAKKLIRYSNKDVYIGNCKAYNNYGRPDYKANKSGNGIVIGGTIGGLVEYCEAYENGKDNGSTLVGPSGILMDNSKNITIQYSISHHNKGGSTRMNGGGFDINGGCYGGVIQECDSYENEGAGYGFFQSATGNQWSNDTVRNNTSTNDARNSAYGAFTFQGGGSAFKVTNAQVYGNRVSMDKAGQVLSFKGEDFYNVYIRDNAFCVLAPATFYTYLSANVNTLNNTFPCQVLSIRTGSLKVKRIS